MSKRRKNRMKRESERQAYLQSQKQQKPQETKGNTMMNSTKKTIKQPRNIAGLMDCALEHTIENTNLTYQWMGPKITRATWDEVIAFFKWTFTEHNSESQVRMFAHPTLGWKAWAFPQRARTGMAAHELDVNEPGYERTIEQRKQFNPDEGWMYFATVHHHCSAGAFQSPTDEHNEKGQDGIHITVGNMGAEIHSLDVRMYYCGYKLTKFDMSWFWDIGNELDIIPKHLRTLMPENLDHITAIRQMCVTCPPDTKFNQVWRENVIEPPKPVELRSHVTYTPPQESGNHYVNGQTSGKDVGKFGRFYGRREPYLQRCFPAYTMDTSSAVAELKNWIATRGKLHNVTMADVEKFFGVLDTWDTIYIEWLDLVLSEDCNISAVLTAIEETMQEDAQTAMEEGAVADAVAEAELLDEASGGVVATPAAGQSEADKKEIEDHMTRLYGEGGWEY